MLSLDGELSRPAYEAIELDSVLQSESEREMDASDLIGLQGRMRRWSDIDTTFTALASALRLLERDHSALASILNAIPVLEARLPNATYDQSYLSPFGGGPTSGNIASDLELEELYGELDDLASAFFVVLQTRLSVVASRTHALAEMVEKALRIKIPGKKQFLEAVHDVWAIANYVKHNDEWGEELNAQQQRTFDQLVQIGIAAANVDARHRYPTPHLAARAALLMAGEHCLSSALQTLVVRVNDQAYSIYESTLTTLEPHADALERLRVDQVARSTTS